MSIRGLVSRRPWPSPAHLRSTTTGFSATVDPLLTQLLWRDRTFTSGLTGAEFSSTDAADLVTGLSGTAPDRGNLGRTLAGLAGLARTENVSAVRSTGRPSTVWRWE